MERPEGGLISRGSLDVPFTDTEEGLETRAIL
jgi:hypothetical protein